MRKRDQEPIWDAETGWRVDFHVEGRRIRRRLGLREKRDRALAQKKAEQLWREAWTEALEEPVRPRATPFYAAARAYVADGGEARFLGPLVEFFGPGTTIDEIGPAELTQAAEALYPGRAPDTIRRQVRVPVSAVIRHARGERRRPSTDRPRTRWLTPEEAERLLDAAARLTLPRHPEPERYTLAKIAAMLGTGMRTGECFAAETRHYNPATRQLWIPAEEAGAGKTAGAARWVRFPARAVELMGPLPVAGRMFRTPYGQPIQLRRGGGGQMQAAFARAREAAGLGADVTPYVLRHTWATWFYAQTLDFGGLMDQGGWRKADMANRYRKLAPDDLADRLLAHGWDFRPPARGELERGALRVVR